MYNTNGIRVERPTTGGTPSKILHSASNGGKNDRDHYHKTLCTATIRQVYVIKLDIPQLRELTSQMSRISNSENQIAKRLNTTGNLYETDIEEIKKNQEEIYEGIRKILNSLSQLD